MNKKIIKEFLKGAFLIEDTKPNGLKATEKAQKESGTENKAATKAVEKTMKDYANSITGEKENEESVKKYERDETADTIYDNELQVGSLANLDPNNDPDGVWEERQKKAMTGENSELGNSNEYANVVTADQAGFTGPKANKEFYDKNVKFKKGKGEAEAKYARNSTGIKGADFDDSKINENKKNKMKILKFKKPFGGISNAMGLIPESYRTNGKKFQMTDGNEKYEIKWEGSLSEGKAIILNASDKGLMNEDFNKMKHLMNFKSQDTTSMGTRKPIRESLNKMNEQRLDEGIMDKLKGVASKISDKILSGLDKSKAGELYNRFNELFDGDFSVTNVKNKLSSMLDSANIQEGKDKGNASVFRKIIAYIFAGNLATLGAPAIAATAYLDSNPFGDGAAIWLVSLIVSTIGVALSNYDGAIWD